jgi:hypothetical protein
MKLAPWKAKFDGHLRAHYGRNCAKVRIRVRL